MRTTQRQNRTTSKKQTKPAWAVLDADKLFRDDIMAEVTPQDKDAFLIPRERIEAGVLNARRHFPPEGLRELGESMKSHGQLQAIVVRPHPRKEDKYEIVSGERRWRAAGAEYGNIETLRCIVGSYSDAEVITLSVVENINREDISPVEKGHALLNMKRVNPGLHWDDIARMVNKSRQWVNDAVSLVEQPEPVQAAVNAGKIPATHARAVRQLPPAQQVKLVQTAIRQNLTRDQLNDRVKELKPPKEPPARTIIVDSIPAPMPPWKRGEAMLRGLERCELALDEVVALAQEGHPSSDQDKDIWLRIEGLELRLKRLKESMPIEGQLRSAA